MEFTLDGGTPADEQVFAYLESLGEKVGERTVPARDESGALVIPSSEFILDAVVRQRELVNTDDLWTHGIYAVAVMDELPECDRCHTAKARYDVIELPAYWACEACYEGYELGAGKAQRLLTYDEVPADVRVVCDALTDLAGRRSVFEGG